MRRREITIQDTVFYIGPQPGDRHYGDEGYVDRPVGSSGKVRGRERGAVYVDWGDSDEGWEPRSYLATWREFEAMGKPGWG